MMDGNKTRQEQQQTSTSLNWQEIEDVLRDYKLMVDGASDGLWIYNVSSDRYNVSKKDRERFDFDPNLKATPLRGRSCCIQTMSRRLWRRLWLSGRDQQRLRKYISPARGTAPTVG